MTKAKWLKLLRSGSLIGLVTSISTTGLALSDKLTPKTGLIVMVCCSFLMAISKALPQLILELMDDNDAILGQSGQIGTGTEVPK
jgi:hypothetical protein